MELYDLLENNPSIRWVSLIWTHETTLREAARLGGRASTLVYKGSVFDLERCFIGPYEDAFEFALFCDAWNGRALEFNEASGVLSGVHHVGYNGRCVKPRDLSDYSPCALSDLFLV